MAAAAGDSSGGDRYRSHLGGEGEKNTVWRHGAPPTYDAVNSLFESGRTQEWPEGSLEETVQNAIKTWEMELSHKARLGDFKSVSPGKFTLSVNGGRARPHRGGDARHGQLQRAARRPDAPGHGGLLRRQGRDLRVLARPVPLRLPARLRVGGRQGLLRPARDRLQVPALGAHGGAVQGPRPHRRQGRVLRRRRPQGGRAAAGGGRGGVLRPRGASRGAYKGRQGGGNRRRSGGARREAQGSGYSVGVER